MKSTNRVKFALHVSLWHFLISLGIGILAALFVFFVLYPYPYYKITDSTSIFFIMMLVDVCCGPLCTLIVASPHKSKQASIIDFVVIGFVQLSALVIGLLSLYTTRPAYEVYEGSNFRMVLVSEIQKDEYDKALPQYRSLPKLGVTTLGTRQAKDAQEQFESINLSIAGIEIGLRPSWWVPYKEVIPDVRAHYKPINQIKPLLPEQQRLDLESALKKYALKASDTYFLPLDNSNLAHWVVLLNQQAEVVGYAAINGYLLND